MLRPHVTPRGALAVHPSGWCPLRDGVEITCLPLIDSATPIDPTCASSQLFARAIQPDIEAFAATLGAELPTREDIERLFELARAAGSELHPVTLPTPDMVAAYARAVGPQPARDTPALTRWLEGLYAPMGTLDWCRLHDAAVIEQMRARGGPHPGRPWANVGKHPIRPHDAGRMRLFGWWDGHRWVQDSAGPHGQHGPDQTDYATLAYIVRRTGGGTTKPTAGTPASPQDAAALYRTARRTPATARTVYEALEAAARGLGLDVSDRVLRILTAQSSFETDQWRSCWCWNLGNVRRRAGQPWLRLRHVVERDEHGNPVTYDDGPGVEFSAFESLHSAAIAWLEFLRTPRYLPAWRDLLEREDAASYVRVLRACGYYTATLEEYTAGTLAALGRVEAALIDVAAALAALGYADVRAFQRAHPPLAVDGIAGPMTCAALRRELDASASR